MARGTREVAGALAGELHAAGTRLLFGVPGGGANLDVVGAAAEAGIDFVLTHDETAACIAAGTHGLLTGSVGAAVVTRGPGLTNAATGLAQATLDRFPLLLISDTVAATMASRVPHQRIDQAEMAGALTKWSGTLGDSEPAAVARAATTLARHAPAGAVHLALDATARGDLPPQLTSAPSIDQDALERAHRMLAASERPVVIAGLETAAAGPEVRDALEQLGAPVLCTYQAKSIVPDTSLLAAGLFTNGALERPLLDCADLVLAVGLDPVEPLPTPWAYDAPVLMLHPYPVEASYFGQPTILTGPLEQTLPQIVTDVEHGWEPTTGAQARQTGIEALEHRSDDLSPHDVVRELARAAPADARVTVDAGAHMLVAMPLWQAERPRQVLISNGLATMGFALPAAIGAALARPFDPVLCLVGDGCLGMTLGELETLARLSLDITVVVFNDSALSLIEIKQTAAQGGTGAVRYGPTDFAAAARGMGVSGCVVDTKDELRAQLRHGLSGPRLIDVRVDPSGYPHVIGATRG